MGILKKENSLYNKMVAFALSIATTSFFGLPSLAMAADVTNPIDSDANADTIATIIKTSVPAVFAISILVAVVVIVWQGVKMVGGNPQAAETAKGTIIRVLIGLAIILAATSIVSLVANTLTTVIGVPA